MTETPDLRYPIGRFRRPERLTEEERTATVAELAQAPARLREAVAGLSPAQLDTPYRPGGWTVRQLVHHVPDSHLNAYTRCKLALTEDEPTIRPYDEDRWARLP
ncbi:MAG TPA: DinB family protein, partial [Thermoanaerobaculia bacterium]|nr:DinB family protein [Thermoanaerobaculia bacterium]